MYNEELYKRYELATSQNYKEIKARCYEFIKSCAKSPAMAVHTNGMLHLIDHIDSWVSDYEAELAKRS